MILSKVSGLCAVSLFLSKHLGRPYFALREADPSLALATGAAGLEGTIYQGLLRLTDDILGREWLRDDGAHLKVERCPIDANWGSSTDVVYQFCRESEFAGVLMPSHGRFVGASGRPFAEYTDRPGDRAGTHWRIPGVRGKREVRHLLYDANFWKSFIAARLNVLLGDRGCLSLFGDRPEAHRLFAEHLCAEYRVRTEGRGRVVDEWKVRPGGGDNHWLDCLAGSAAAASVQGCALREHAPRRRRSRADAGVVMSVRCAGEELDSGRRSGLCNVVEPTPNLSQASSRSVLPTRSTTDPKFSVMVFGKGRSDRSVSSNSVAQGI